MIIVTGTQGSGKSTVSKILGEELSLPTDAMWNYNNKIKNVDIYRTLLYHMSKQKVILEAALPDAFSFQLLQTECHVVLIRAPVEIKLDRLAARDNTSREFMENKFRYEFDELQMIEDLILPTYIINNENLDDTIAQVRSIAEYML